MVGGNLEGDRVELVDDETAAGRVHVVELGQRVHLARSVHEVEHLGRPVDERVDADELDVGELLAELGDVTADGVCGTNATSRLISLRRASVRSVSTTTCCVPIRSGPSDSASTPTCRPTSARLAASMASANGENGSRSMRPIHGMNHG